MRILNYIGLVTLVMLLSACAVTHQGVSGKSGMAILQFSGDCAGVSFQVDDNAMISLVGPCEKTQFTVMPGRHTVTVYRENRVIVEKYIQFSADVTSEVALP